MKQILPCKYITSASNGFWYGISSENELLKYDSSFHLLTSNHIKYLGNAKIIDATNPFDISILYPDDNVIVVVDNNLNYKFQIDHLNTISDNITTFAKSYDNEFWIYDANYKTILKLNSKGEVLKQTNNLEFIIKEKLNPIQLYDNGQNLMIYNQDKNILVLDLNGRLIRKFNLPTQQRFVQFQQNRILLTDTNGVYSILTDKRNDKQDTLCSPCIQAMKTINNSVLFYYSNTIYIIKQENKLYIYTKQENKLK